MIKLNDRVVCISKSPNHTTIVGREYIVYGIYNCSCGIRSFDIGLPMKPEFNSVFCHNCGDIYGRDSGIQYIGEFRFRKVEEATTVNYVKLEVEIEEPILN